MRPFVALLVTGGLMLALSSGVGAQSPALVTVVHGIPDATVDVYVNDQRVLSEFQFGTVTDPLSLAAGSYSVAIRPAGADPASQPILSATAELSAGQNVSLVAHLTADGQPALRAFVNDTSPLAAGKARLTVRHTAAAPTVDILAGDARLVTNLSNPDEAKADVDAGTYSVSIAPAGQATAVFGPLSLTLNAGTNYIVYAVGSLQQNNFRLLIQQIHGLGGGPTGAATGLGGTGPGAIAPWSLGLFALAALGLFGISRIAVARARARTPRA
jgi:hypothetical protein